MLQRLRRHSRLAIVAVSCLAVGAGASAIANAGASGASPTARTAHAHAHTYGHRVGRGRGMIARAVHGDVVVATRHGFVHVSFDRGIVKSVSGNELVLQDGTKSKTYETVTRTIPVTAHVRDNGARATLAAVKPGQRALVLQTPTHTWIIAHDVK